MLGLGQPFETKPDGWTFLSRFPMLTGTRFLAPISFSQDARDARRAGNAL